MMKLGLSVDWATDSPPFSFNTMGAIKEPTIKEPKVATADGAGDKFKIEWTTNPIPKTVGIGFVEANVDCELNSYDTMLQFLDYLLEVDPPQQLKDIWTQGLNAYRLGVDIILTSEGLSKEESNGLWATLLHIKKWDPAEEEFRCIRHIWLDAGYLMKDGEEVPIYVQEIRSMLKSREAFFRKIDWAAEQVIVPVTGDKPRGIVVKGLEFQPYIGNSRKLTPPPPMPDDDEDLPEHPE